MAGRFNDFDRSFLIDLLVKHIKAECDVPVGDHIAPDSGGWSAGQPGTGTFVAYTVLSTGPVRVVPSALCDGCYDYSATVTTRSFGTTRQQADDIAMAVRASLHAYKPVFGANKVRIIWCSQIGAVDRMDDTNPKYWRVQDTYTVDCTPL